MSPFVLFTGDNRKDVVNEALALGAERYFNKNCNTETLYIELAHTIRKAVTNKHKAAMLHKNERNATETSPVESEKKFYAITNFTKDGIILIDNKGKTVYLNPAAEKLFGYTKKEVIGKNLHRLLAPKNFLTNYREGLLTSNKLEKVKQSTKLSSSMLLTKAAKQFQ